MKKLFGRFRLMEVFSSRSVFRILLLGITITLVTMNIGLVAMPLINIMQKDQALRAVLPGVQRMIYATRAYILPGKSDLEELAERPEVEAIYYTGVYTCALSSGEWVYVSVLSADLFDALHLQAEKGTHQAVPEERPTAYISPELKNQYVTGDSVELSIQRSPVRIEDPKRLSFSVTVDGFLKKNAVIPALKVNAAPNLTLDDIGGRVDSELIKGFILVRADSETEYYLNHEVGLLKVAQGYETGTVRKTLEDRYGSTVYLEDYPSVLSDSYKVMLEDGSAHTLRFLLGMLAILAVSIYGILLVDRQNNLRSDMILYQLGLTRPAVTGLHLLYTVLVSLPWTGLGIILSKRRAIDRELQGSWGYTKEVVVVIAVCYLLVLLAVGLTFSLSQKRRSASEIYKEA